MQLQVSGLKSGGSILDKAVIRNISESCPKPKKIDRSEDIFLFRQVNKVPGNQNLYFCFSFSDINPLLNSFLRLFIRIRSSAVPL